MSDHAPISPSSLYPGAVVAIEAFDDIPEHLFEVQEVHEDCITGVALTGPLSGAYGEPAIEMVLRIVPASKGRWEVNNPSPSLNTFRKSQSS